MQMTTLGKTGLQVSRLGMGLSEIGELLDVEEAARVLDSALDGGINFLDTAACYGNSEELIGRSIVHRRHEYVLATKCGHIAGGYGGQPWTAQTVKDSIDRSLTRIKTDYLDLVQLHSCDVPVLERGDVIQALLDAREAGKTRFVGYSGDNEAASWAVESGHFDTLQTSFNMVDQRARTRLLGIAETQGLGIIIKRPIANGAWGAESSPKSYADDYFNRAHVMSHMEPIPGAPDNRIMAALGFVFAHPEVDTAIVGTRNPSHMLSNIQMVENSNPLPAGAVDELHRRFDQVGQDWVQLG